MASTVCGGFVKVQFKSNYGYYSSKCWAKKHHGEGGFFGQMIGNQHKHNGKLGGFKIERSFPPVGKWDMFHKVIIEVHIIFLALILYCVCVCFYFLIFRLRFLLQFWDLVCSFTGAS